MEPVLVRKSTSIWMCILPAVSQGLSGENPLAGQRLRVWRSSRFISNRTRSRRRRETKVIKKLSALWAPASFPPSSQRHSPRHAAVSKDRLDACNILAIPAQRITKSASSFLGEDGDVEPEGAVEALLLKERRERNAKRERSRSWKISCCIGQGTLRS